MDDKSPAIALYCSLVRGSATKTKLRKSTRFTDEQEALMENCFDMGETEKKNRYTAQSCKQLMEERLGKEMGLTTVNRRRLVWLVGKHQSMAANMLKIK
jgi:hypothetical protein